MVIRCLLLAAGQGRRFGSCKLLVRINGKPLVRYALEAVASVSDKQPYIVLGAYKEEIQSVVRDIAKVIENPVWQNGLGSSIARGIREIEEQDPCDGVLIALADQSRITAADLSKLINEFDGQHTVAAYYEDGPGVPAIFPSSLLESLKKLDGDRGAKSILLDMQSEIVTVPMPHAALDIDTVEDVSRIYGMNAFTPYRKT